MNKIDFIGIGAVKCGTTWLAENLRLHPEIFLPEDKGVNYFNPTLPNTPGKRNPRHRKSLEWYHSYYAGAKPGQIIGEFAPVYMRAEGTAERIHSYCKDIKLFAILRKPADQVFSRYRFLKQNGQLNDIPIFDVLEQHAWIKEAGNFGSQLKPFYDLFPQEQIRVFLFDDIIKAPQALFNDVCDFLGAKQHIDLPSPREKNVTGNARNSSLSKLMFNSRKLLAKPAFRPVERIMQKSGLMRIGAGMFEKNISTTTPKEKLSDKEKLRLTNIYIEEIELTEKLTGIDLKEWKQEEARDEKS